MASEQAAIATTGPAGGPALFFPSACEGIRRTDRLCAELWKTIQNEPEYAGGRHYSFFRTLGATRTMMRAGTDFNIIAPATLPLGLLG